MRGCVGGCVVVVVVVVVVVYAIRDVCCVDLFESGQPQDPWPCWAGVRGPCAVLLSMLSLLLLLLLGG